MRLKLAYPLVGGIFGLLSPMACGESGFVGGRCDPDYAYCGGQCVDLDTDESHCGRCENECDSDQVCREGSCTSADPSGGGGEAGGSGRTGGSSSSSGGEGNGSGGNGNGSGGGSSTLCLPPFNTPMACGNCETSCPDSAPFCQPNQDTFECVTNCNEDPYLATCGGACVDTESDPEHCGACFVDCPSGICIDGNCIGATPGHLIALCMNYELYLPQAAQSTILGNAVFLSNHEPVRVLAYTKHAPLMLRSSTNAVLAAQATVRGRTIEITAENDPDDLVDRLERADFDVLLVYDQTSAPSGSMSDVGQAWQAKVQEFAEDGGVSVVLTGGTSEMNDFISELGLLTVDDTNDMQGDRFYTQAAGDVLAANVVSPFLGVKKSCAFVTSDVPAGNLVFVNSDTDPADGLGAPGIVHRIVQP